MYTNYNIRAHYGGILYYFKICTILPTYQNINNRVHYEGDIK